MTAGSLPVRAGGASEPFSVRERYRSGGAGLKGAGQGLSRCAPSHRDPASDALCEGTEKPLCELALWTQKTVSQ